MTFNDDTTGFSVKRIGPFGLVVLFHIALIYALQNGLVHQVVQLLPAAVSVMLITPEPKPPEPPKPPAMPQSKAVQPVKHVAAPQPKPPVTETPVPGAITVPTAPPAPPTTAEATVAVAAPPAPPAPVTPSQPKTISSGVEYLQPPRPEYPPQSRRFGEEGKVMLRVLVSEAGRPQRAEVQNSSGSARLDEAARQAVMRAVFKPHLEDGKAVTVFVLVPINFQINS